MSTDPIGGSRNLPERPDIRHLKDQAKDLLRAGTVTCLADAQFHLAREYGFDSWPKLKKHVESLQEAGRLKAAIDAGDVVRVKQMMTHNPSLHHAPLGYGRNGPLTWIAECRGTEPTSARLEMARWMVEHGSDIHQGGDGPLMRAALNDNRLPMMELLVELGADVNALWGGHYPIICAPCETLQPESLKWLLRHGVDDTHLEACVSMLIGTYWRNASGKYACLEVFAESGFLFPDTAPVAIHRGRIDLLEQCVRREPGLLTRHFSEAEIYPLELGIKPGDGLHCAPLDGCTLLHMAVEYQDPETALWLIQQGADVNAASAIDSEGFGGHTPLYHTTVTLVEKADVLARLLLQHGANPNVRATFRKQLRLDDPELGKMREFHDATAIEYAEQFQEPNWVNHAAVAAIREYGGQ